jgi:hypothetical protein
MKTLDSSQSRSVFREIINLVALMVSLSVSPLVADTIAGTVIDASSDGGDKTQPSDTPASADTPASLQKAAGTPQFWQLDPRGEFENQGRDFCCPVAVSNSLVYFAHHGFPALLPEGSGVRAQINLINTLASSDYFGTDPDNGTAPGSVLSGVQKYVEEMGYSCSRLEYEGWRNVGRSRQSAVKAARPSLDWLKEGIGDANGAVWLNVGWYKRVDQGEWKRTGGHWVTLVGYGASQSGGATDPLLLLVHNPAKSANAGGTDNFANDVVELTPIEEGTLDTGKDSTEDAAGMYRMSGPGLPVSRNVDAAILDAAIVLVIK